VVPKDIKITLETKKNQTIPNLTREGPYLNSRNSQDGEGRYGVESTGGQTFGCIAPSLQSMFGETMTF